MKKEVLSVSNLSKTYSGIPVLKQASFSLLEGEVHALVGENGAGKSTLIKLISGVETPDPGASITVGGKTYASMTVEHSSAMGISVIYQDISLFPNMRVDENIVMGHYAKRFVNRQEITKFAQDAFHRVHIDMKMDDKVGDLSVGQQQIVAIVRAISSDARVIIMDEPTAALSSGEVRILFDIIEKLKSMNIAIIYISHKLEEVFTVADRISVLRDGEIVAEGDTNEFDTKTLISKMVGRPLRFLPIKKTQDSQEVLFEVRGLENDKVHVESLKIHKYEVVGLTGLVGAGRTEMAQTIFGLMRADAGQVFVHGREIRFGTVKRAIKAGIGYLPENRITQGLFYGQNIVLNTTSASLYKFSNAISYMDNPAERRSTQEFIEMLEVRPNMPDAKIESFSGGNQQKILIGRWLSVDPKVLIVDEPTSGVDVGAKLAIHKQIRALAERGMAILLISSDLSEVMAVADRILVMRGGTIVYDSPAGEATNEIILEKGLIG